MQLFWELNISHLSKVTSGTIHLFVTRSWLCFKAVMKTVAVNLGLYKSLCDTDLISFVYISRTVFAESCGILFVLL